MVEQDAGAAEHVVRFPILPDDPKTVQLGHRIGGTGVKRGLFALGNFLHLAVQLGGGRLVNTRLLCQPGKSDRLQNAQHTEGVNIRCVLRRVKADMDMTLRGEVVNLVRAHGADHFVDRACIGQISIVEVELREPFQVCDTLSVIHAAAANQAVNVVALIQQKLRQIRAVLPCHTGNQCLFQSILSQSFLLAALQPPKEAGSSCFYAAGL